MSHVGSEILPEAESSHPTSVGSVPDSSITQYVGELRSNGIVALPTLVSPDQLAGMQRAFAARLLRIRWNNFDGYEKTEPYRHVIEDVLLLDRGFLDVAIHPIVKSVVRAYLGDHAELTEARGWKSLPTKRDFHGWHGDAWYDQTESTKIPKELKLAFYLTDVRSGAFNYMCGTHQKQHPRPVPNVEVKNLRYTSMVEMMGAAGTAFLFDTSGIHRQGVPMLEERQAVFFNYHDPAVKLQKDDRRFYRYHPLLLNAAFLGNLSDEDERLLGFGNETRFIPGYVRPAEPPFIYRCLTTTFNLHLRAKVISERIANRLRRMRTRG